MVVVALHVFSLRAFTHVVSNSHPPLAVVQTYNDQTDIATVLASSGVSRSDVFITTKIPSNNICDSPTEDKIMG